MLTFIDIETRIPPDHPSLTIKRLADAASLVFDAMYATEGRASIPPERLSKAHLLMALDSVRSERAFREELDYHLLYRWFLDMDLVEQGFAPSTFNKNRQRLLEHEVAVRFFDEVVGQADDRGLLRAHLVMTSDTRSSKIGGRPKTYDASNLPWFINPVGPSRRGRP